MAESQENHDPTEAVAEHKDCDVKPPRRRLLMKGNSMDLLINAFGLLAIISGGVLGVVGIFTHWKNKETVAIWALYFTIIFAVTAFFLVWQKRISESQAATATAKDAAVPMPSDRPWLTVEAVAASPFTFNSGPLIVADNNTAQLVVRFIITNTGQSPANGAIVKAEIIFPKPEDTITDSLKRQQEMCKERGNRRDHATIFNRPETVDITFLLSIDKMIAQFAREKRKWAKPILVGCVDYLVDGTSHQTGFMYDILRLGAGGQSQRVINIGENVPIDQLLFLKSSLGGDYAN